MIVNVFSTFFHTPFILNTSSLTKNHRCEELLKFYLRMGFEEVESSASISPVEGVRKPMGGTSQNHGNFTPPKSSILFIGFGTIIFTIHFGIYTPIFGNALSNTPNLCRKWLKEKVFKAGPKESL